jgi:LuxR family maltose regulon positive regulatory protein
MAATEAVLAEALETAQTTGNVYAALTAMIFQGRVLAVRGKLHQAAVFFQQALEQDKEMPINALAQMDLAALQYEWNALEASEEHLQQAIRLSQRGQNDEFLAGCWLMGSCLRLAQGDPSGAEEMLEKAGVLARARKISTAMAERVQAADVYVRLAKGETVEKLGQGLTESVDCHPFYRFLGVVRARSLPEVQALGYLEGLAQTAQANEWVYGLVAVRSLQATLAETPETGLTFLREALHLGESGSFLRTFAEAGERLVPLLREAARCGISPVYVGRILAVVGGGTESVDAGQAAMVEPLSERELEVLNLVTAGLSNREIADKLVISIGTAKSHVHHLCGKLGVRNRTEAAVRARELGLVK